MKVIYTKVAGVTMDPERQRILSLLQSKNVADIPLVLKAEFNNEFDPDAVQVIAINKKGEEFVLGYLPNRDAICSACDAVFERFPNSNSCPTCNRMGTLSRFGLATRLKDNISRIHASISAITGGDSGRNFGCNLKLEVEEPGTEDW